MNVRGRYSKTDRERNIKIVVVVVVVAKVVVVMLHKKTQNGTFSYKTIILKDVIKDAVKSTSAQNYGCMVVLFFASALIIIAYCVQQIIPEGARKQKTKNKSTTKGILAHTYTSIEKEQEKIFKNQD